MRWVKLAHIFCVWMYLCFLGNALAFESPSLSCFGTKKDKIEIDSKQLSPTENQWGGTCYSHATAHLISAANYRRTGKKISLSEEHIAFCTSLGCNNIIDQLCSKGAFSSGYGGASISETLSKGEFYIDDSNFENEMRDFFENSAHQLKDYKGEYIELKKQLDDLKVDSKESSIARTRLNREIKLLIQFKRNQIDQLKKTKEATKKRKAMREIIANIHQEIKSKRSELKKHIPKHLSDQNTKRKINTLKKRIIQIAKKSRFKENTQNNGSKILEKYRKKLVELSDFEFVDTQIEKTNLDSNKYTKKPEFQGSFSCTFEENMSRLKTLEKALCMNMPLSVGVENIGTLKHREKSSPKWKESIKYGGHLMIGKKLGYIDGRIHLIFQNSWGENSEAALSFEDFCMIDEAYLVLDKRKSERDLSESDWWKKANKKIEPESILAGEQLQNYNSLPLLELEGHEL